MSIFGRNFLSIGETKLDGLLKAQRREADRTFKKYLIFRNFEGKILQDRLAGAGGIGKRHVVELDKIKI
jgi:hypothetical protein